MPNNNDYKKDDSLVLSDANIVVQKIFAYGKGERPTFSEGERSAALGLAKQRYKEAGGVPEGWDVKTQGVPEKLESELKFTLNAWKASGATGTSLDPNRPAAELLATLEEMERMRRENLPAAIQAMHDKDPLTGYRAPENNPSRWRR